MTRNDGFYKILFAIEIALISMVVFANMFLENWALSLFVGGILVVKIWRQIFKEKDNKAHTIIASIASMLEFSILIIYFAAQKMLILPLAIVAVVIVVLYGLLKIAFANVKMIETIDAVDFCFVIFEFLMLVAFVILPFFGQIATIALWTIVLCGAVSVIYKVYYGFKYDSWGSKIKAIFTKR